MNAHPVSNRLPECQKLGAMSYMYGSHMCGPGIYFGGDDMVVSTDVTSEKTQPPAWLVADWMLAKHRGESVSPRANSFLNQPSVWNAGLKWLAKCLDQYETT